MMPYGNIELKRIIIISGYGLAAPSHYLNQYWLIISKGLQPSSDGNINY